MREGSGLQRAQRFMMLATGLYRASHLVAGFVAVLRKAPGEVLPWVLFGGVLASSVWLYGNAYARGWFDRRWVWADVLVTGCAVPLLVGLASGGVAGGGWVPGGAGVAVYGWLFLLGGSVSAAAGVGLAPRRAVVAVLLLLGTTLAAYLWVIGPEAAPGSALVGHMNSVVSSAVMAKVFWWYLRRQGTQLDEANERALTAEAARAREAERIAHHRALHDTVLATLTTIAVGRVDANAPGVRERCAREAAYLRRLIQRGDDPEDAGAQAPEVAVGAVLEEAVHSAECLGLKVTAQYHELPSVPRPVAIALAAAVSEALNNVRCHAGTGQAFLTVVGAAGGVFVRVVDRGVGFDPTAPGSGSGTGTGSGLRRSIHARLAEIGGRSEVDSAPGEGTSVELRWPA
ncbi:signal transduction histidine kinase [Streptomyces sp. 3211.6]|uniref:sensor histidine kinase n=1 Tax=Streptomyces TaxID=1883 RepID=UPI0009A484EE|nr:MULTISPECIES: ATP-binding protein [Streptomyces]RKT03342.1 signal transduction histidine kinase [Streptomyces sp. 3211.6]RPF29238.1 signal transduction histidine kinase [Streptomyces sp. Ag109_G2-6]